ncbi:MAG: hypothetical protein JRH17_07155 [Deltaproteobacteria bacterium]|nr:hypothetical protein [Deltaproteobacteria bacterium]
MSTYQSISNAIFDRLLAPFGHDLAAFDLLLWPILMGVGALQVYKYVSNQKAIAAVKRQIGMHLLEIRLFRDDIVQVLASTGKIVAKNFLYLGHNLVPLLVMIAPMLLVMVQLVSHYAYEPSLQGAVEVLELELDPEASLSPRDVSLRLPEGVLLDAPRVRTADGRVFWRLRAAQSGDHILAVRVGDETYEKVWAVGGGNRKIPVKRLRSWEALLYPGEPPIPADAPILAIGLAGDTRTLRWIPDGEGGILIWAMVVSMIAGIALKGVFGVTL